MQQHPTVGAAVAARRVHLGMRQRDLAMAAGVSETTIRNIEADRIGGRPTKWPLVEQALRWAAGSFEVLRSGGQPQIVDVADSRGDTAHSGAWSPRVPVRIRDELAEHELFDSAVIDVGAGLRVVLLAVETEPPPDERAGRRLRVDRWEDLQQRVRALSGGD